MEKQNVTQNFSRMKKAVFVDKDGTLIKDIPYNVDPERIELYDKAAQSLKALKENGFMIVLISNQSGVAKGYFEEIALKGVEEKIQKELAGEDVQFDAMFFCPHHPEGIIEAYSKDCECRKPRPGMILNASKQFGIQLKHSWMIGDILHDVEAGNRAGCKTILINNGNETEWRINSNRLPTRVASSIADAANLILSEESINEPTSRL
jgi:D-glycero-D-manno-heptose 1,7-bisphosphate phosphatase